MNTEHYALEIAEPLPVGTVRGSLTCPECNGGEHSEASFAVGREPSRIWWNCFRASCGAKGVSGSHRLETAPVVARAIDRIRPYTKPWLETDTIDEIYFGSRFDLYADTITENIRVSEDDTYLLPYRDYMGNIRGVVDRSPAWKGWPKPVRTGNPPQKAKTYIHSTDPVCGWYRGSWASASKAIVVVEDQISAMRVAQAGATALAMLGSNINQEVVRDMYLKHPRQVILAFDPDAQGMAQQTRRKWGGYFDRMRIVALEADPKDVPYPDLMEELGL